MGNGPEVVLRGITEVIGLQRPARANAPKMPRSRKINLEKVLASLDTKCPKCGFTITPDLVKRVDFERMECRSAGRSSSPAGASEK